MTCVAMSDSAVLAPCVSLCNVKRCCGSKSQCTQLLVVAILNSVAIALFILLINSTVFVMVRYVCI